MNERNKGAVLFHTESGKDSDVGERTVLLRALDDEHSQQLIKRAHREWLAALDAIQDPIFIHDRGFRVLRSNLAYAKRAGMSVKEVVGRPYYEMFPRHDGPMSDSWDVVRHGGEMESEILPGDGRVYLSRAAAVMDEEGKYAYSMHIMYDITERKRLEVCLRASETNYRLLFESSRDALTTIVPPSWKFSNANAAALKLFGVKTEEEFITLAPWELAPELQPDGMLSSDKARQVVQDAMQEGFVQFEWTHKRMDSGAEFIAEVLITRVERDGEVFLQASTRDITERKRGEQVMQNLNRALKTLSAGNHELVHATDEKQLLLAMCRVIVEAGGYRMAWVGYLGNDAEKSIRPMAQAGFEEGYLERAHITWADTERGRGPSGKAARSGQIQIAQNIMMDINFALWRAEAMKRGYSSSIALPLIENGKTFGVLSIYAEQADAFNPGEVGLLREMSEDLAFGISTQRAREEQKHTAQQLREGLEDTVKVIAAMVEMRDPYTSGHQQRVANLARAIAVEIGYPEARLEGLHLAGLIHDLGKIQVPAEILSKPGRLTETEYLLIKTHPQTGYDVLKDIEFPWPIAQMVYQHHERIDGSGYPRGLKGDEIIPEARILVVADVVEAMASHRPYRPGLGVAAALDELRKNSGKFYDTEAVDACIRLFEQNRIQMPGEWAKH